MKRTACFSMSIVMAAAFAWPIFAQSSASPKGPMAGAKSDKAMSRFGPGHTMFKPQPVRRLPRTLAVLNKVVEEVDWDEMPLEEALDWVTDQGPINVVVRWRALEDAGIDRDSPITLRLKGTTVGTVLSEVLEQVSDLEEVRFRGEGEILRISTRADLNRKMYLRTYNVTDLLLEVRDFTDGPAIDIQQASGGGRGGGGQPVFSGSGGGGGDREDEDQMEERLEDLIDVIKTSVEPLSWQESGGEGTIVGMNHHIVVRNSLDVHVQLGGMFYLE
jgi:hypothetical protein